MPGLLDALTGGLGYAGDVMEKFGGREARGLLGGHPRELLSAIPFSDTLGITDPRERVRGSDLARQWGLARDEDPFGMAAAGFGLDVATDPLTYLGGLGLGRHALRAAPGAAEPLSRFGLLRRLREPTAMVKDLGGPAERVVGASAFRGAFPDFPVRDMMVDKAREIMGGMGGGLPADAEIMGGMVPPWSPKVGGLGFAVAPEFAGHELAHGMVHNAAAHGGEAALPFLGREAARQYRAGHFRTTGFHAGLGNILDELNAAGIETRKVKGYLGGALGQALSPQFHRLYHPQFSRASPLAAGLFHAAPGVLPGAAAGAAGGGAVGYQQDGGEGALAGALLGGLGGAALGGGLSHLALAPSALNKMSELEGLAGGAGAIRKPPGPPGEGPDILGFAGGGGPRKYREGFSLEPGEVSGTLKFPRKPYVPADRTGLPSLEPGSIFSHPEHGAAARDMIEKVIGIGRQPGAEFDTWSAAAFDDALKTARRLSPVKLFDEGGDISGTLKFAPKEEVVHEPPPGAALRPGDLAMDPATYHAIETHPYTAEYHPEYNDANRKLIKMVWGDSFDPIDDYSARQFGELLDVAKKRPGIRLFGGGDPGPSGTTAAIRIPGRPAGEGRKLRDWLTGVDQDLPEIAGDLSTPYGRASSLADAAKVNFYRGGQVPGFTGDPIADVRNLIGHREGQATAVYDPANQMIIPNIFDEPKMWTSTGHMQDMARMMYPHHEANLRDIIAGHEIGHALHHKGYVDEIHSPWDPFFEIEKPWSGLARRLSPDNPMAAPGVWQHWAGRIREQPTPYRANTWENPSEYVADQFAKWLAGSAGRTTPAPLERALTPEMIGLYNQLGGPTPPGGLLEKYLEFLGSH